MTQSRSTAISAAIVAAVMVGSPLYFGRVVFMPIALALVLASVLGPLVGGMEKVRIPAPAGSALLLLGILALVTGAGLRSSTRFATGLVRHRKRSRPRARRCRSSGTASIGSALL